MSSFKKEMKGIYCSCIGKETLDEAPFAYRNMEMIKEAVEDTVDITPVSYTHLDVYKRQCDIFDRSDGHESVGWQ